MKEFLEGSIAVAKIVALCRPGVISAYPITPQTHIVEELAQMVADGHLNSQFINVESEHSACSAVLGAAATGVRSYTATSSQGLLLMTEVVFCVAGMRVPLVMTCANRAISAPINIWNDQQDSMTVRDSGWIQLYGENNQEVCDLHIQAYKLTEMLDVPVMVCMDGFILTHGFELVDIPEQAQVDKFLLPFNPTEKLDVNNPMTLGYLAGPEVYMEIRYALHKTNEEALAAIPKVADEFSKGFGRKTGGLIECYKTEDAEQVIVVMGSLAGTVKDVVDEQRAQGKKVGVIKVITYRPFPAEAIYNALKNIKEVAVLEKAISLGSFGPLYTEIKSAFCGKCGIVPQKVSGFVIGLGGRDITKDNILDVFNKLSGKQVDCEFIGLKQELLK